MKLILYGLLTILLDDWARVGHVGKLGRMNRKCYITLSLSAYNLPIHHLIV